MEKATPGCVTTLCQLIVDVMQDRARRFARCRPKASSNSMGGAADDRFL